MSKAVKKLFNSTKKIFKKIRKYVLPVLAIAAIVFTGGAALGYFGASGATGMAGIKAAWGGLLSGAGSGGAAAASNSAGLVPAGASVTGAAGAPVAGLQAAAAEAAAGATITPMAAGGGALVPLNVGGQTVMASMPGLMAPTGSAAAASGGLSIGKAMLGASALQAGGAYMQGRAQEQAADEERARFNHESNAYGINRNGVKVGDYKGANYGEAFRTPPGGGLMAPQAPTPTTIDELIQARKQGVA